MSTIEKAASRLASRQKPGGRSAAPVSGEFERREQTPGRPELDIAPLRFCEIDLDLVRERGFLLPDAGRSHLGQEMRRIKRPLLLNIQKDRAVKAAGPPANLIMITSALPGEGKTFTAINLAMSVAAELDKRVLLVDADVARGDVSRQLGIETDRGLSDLIRETSHLVEDAVLTSNIDRLSILPAGSATDQVDELFASDMMGLVTRSLAEADPNRVVIFDASPLLATTEAAVLAQHMGQTLVVVEAGKTPQDAVAQAITQLHGAANVSLVLNKTTGKDTVGYEYGYGSDGTSDREERQAEAG